MQKIIDEKDMVRLAKYFKELILKSYGVKSDDGKRFIKSPELSEAFSQTEAYSELYMELLGNSEYAVKFIQQVMPKDLDQNEVVPAGNVTVLRRGE